MNNFTAPLRMKFSPSVAHFNTEKWFSKVYNCFTVSFYNQKSV